MRVAGLRYRRCPGDTLSPSRSTRAAFRLVSRSSICVLAVSYSREMLDSSVRCVAFNLSTCGTGNAKHRNILSWNVVTSACLLIAHLPLLLLAGRVQLAYTLPLLLDERVERRRVARGRGRRGHRLALSRAPVVWPTTSIIKQRRPPIATRPSLLCSITSGTPSNSGILLGAQHTRHTKYRIPLALSAARPCRLSLSLQHIHLLTTAARTALAALGNTARAAAR